jgi:hypothetical protein
MDVLDNKSDKDLLDSMIPEVAKAMNEIRCARRDLDKAVSRVSFLLVIINEMINRQEIKR